MHAAASRPRATAKVTIRDFSSILRHAMLTAQSGGVRRDD